MYKAGNHFIIRVLRAEILLKNPKFICCRAVKSFGVEPAATGGGKLNAAGWYANRTLTAQAPVSPATPSNI
ncbi:hypothetical protein AWB82_04328 [Caballeronia glebae]|uniref:Uncharacterized protein n=1 Tax=Caballeronia glebae TaxID=1777143 RepID=A0A158BNJ8_9BURK|nr:hypothetical protein AWB82_04328 [Caballeronia glebae]